MSNAHWSNTLVDDCNEHRNEHIFYECVDEICLSVHIECNIGECDGIVNHSGNLLTCFCRHVIWVLKDPNPNFFDINNPDAYGKFSKYVLLEPNITENIKKVYFLLIKSIIKTKNNEYY